MNKSTQTLVFISLLSAGFATAPAQVASGAASAAANAAAHPPLVVPPVKPPVTPVVPPVAPPPAAVPSVTAGVAQGVNATAAAALPAVNAAGRAATSSTVNAAASGAGVNAGATNQVTVAGQAGGVAANPALSSQAAVALAPAATMQEIRDASFAARNSVSATVSRRLDASARTIAALEARATAAGDKSRAALAHSLVEVRAREKALRDSLRATTLATGAAAWGSVQSQLAQDYGAYAQAVADAEASIDLRKD